MRYLLDTTLFGGHHAKTSQLRRQGDAVAEIAGQCEALVVVAPGQGKIGLIAGQAT